jgi:hypothetical protein
VKGGVDKATFDQTRKLAQETAKALDGLLRNEVLLWQAVDDLKSRLPAPESGERPCA